MITSLRIERFKSWRDTGQIELAPLTGFFGTNSSGKTSILQLLLMLKQTAASSDRKQVLHTGDPQSIVDLGTYADLRYAHAAQGPVTFSLDWTLSRPLNVKEPEDAKKAALQADQLSFEAAIGSDEGSPQVESFRYSFSDCRFGMQRREGANGKLGPGYSLEARGYDLRKRVGRPAAVPQPVKFYGFPDEAIATYQNSAFLRDLALALEKLLGSIAYLGPLREYPRRQYVWAGEAPVDVGPRGERAVEALLAAESEHRRLPLRPGRGRAKKRFLEFIARKLVGLGLIDSFEVRQIAEGRKDYEVPVRVPRSATEVLMSDVGFGVSQVLPVLVLCYYAPEGSIIILEQPEIHLHPSVQAALADVLIDAVKCQGVQLIVESHSEHLLRRLQRRIADETLKPDQSALYFCRMERGSSHIERLSVDLFGSIANWPRDFFGDEMGDLVAMTEARLRRETK
jgi:predicted ATPase